MYGRVSGDVWVWSPEHLEGVVSNEGTVVQLQDLQGFETSSAHQVTDPVVCDPFAVREGLERATERERERERERLKCGKTRVINIYLIYQALKVWTIQCQRR